MCSFQCYLNLSESEGSQSNLVLFLSHIQIFYFHNLDYHVFSFYWIGLLFIKFIVGYKIWINLRVNLQTVT